MVAIKHEINSKTARHDMTLPKALRLCHRLAYWMDEAFTVPLVNRKVGFDALIGLAPGLGDVVSFAVSLVPIGVGLYWRLPWPVLASMCGAIVLDLLVGSIPILGDVFDAGFKANRRNAKILHQAWQKHLKPDAAGQVVDV